MGLTYDFDASQFLAQLALGTSFGEQSIPYQSGIEIGQAAFEFASRFLAGHQAADSQRFGGCPQQALHFRMQQVVARRGMARKGGVLRRKGVQRSIHHAMGVGQYELHPLGQRSLQRLVRLVAAVGGHSIQVIAPGIRVLRHARLKTPPHQGHSAGIVLQELVLTR